MPVEGGQLRAGVPRGRQGVLLLGCSDERRPGLHLLGTGVRHQPGHATAGAPANPVPVRMCEPGPNGDGGCAYRPHSPERDGRGGYQGDAEHLEYLAATVTPFYCHRGMRQAVAWQHPAGIEIPGHPADYQPPILNGVPYQADGSPGFICAGWLLRAATIRRQREAAA